MVGAGTFESEHEGDACLSRFVLQRSICKTWGLWRREGRISSMFLCPPHLAGCMQAALHLPSPIGNHAAQHQRAQGHVLSPQGLCLGQNRGRGGFCSPKSIHTHTHTPLHTAPGTQCLQNPPHSLFKMGTGNKQKSSLCTHGPCTSLPSAGAWDSVTMQPPCPLQGFVFVLQPGQPFAGTQSCPLNT